MAAETQHDASESGERLDLLVRNEAGRTLRPKLVARVRELARDDSVDLPFLPLEQSDGLRERFRAVFTKEGSVRKRVVVKWASRASLKSATTGAARTASPRTLFVFFQASDRIGAAKLTSEEFFRIATEMVVADGDAIYTAVDDFSNGLVLDRTETGDDECFEAEIWGDEWSQLLHRD